MFGWQFIHCIPGTSLTVLVECPGGALILTLHAGHHETALQMIDAGKHVLVEKCFAMNAREATEMVEAAKEKVCNALAWRNICWRIVLTRRLP